MKTQTPDYSWKLLTAAVTSAVNAKEEILRRNFSLQTPGFLIPLLNPPIKYSQYLQHYNNSLLCYFERSSLYIKLADPTTETRIMISAAEVISATS
jgi:hypothetical protein